MIIKASGYFLEEVSEETGHVTLDLETHKPTEENTRRPSMEFPLHLLLNRFVIHTHPVAAGALLCSKEGAGAFRDLFPESHAFWIPYTTPGQKLFLKVKETLEKADAAGLPEKLLLLENHGLFAAAETPEDAERLHDQAIHRCHQAFPPPVISDAVKIDRRQYLTPDHVVYFHMSEASLSEKQRQCLGELESFAARVLERIHQRGWTPRFLGAEAVHELLGMEEERYRQNLWKPKP